MARRLASRARTRPERRRAHAQLVVIDPGNLVQTILIAARTEQHYRELVPEFQSISGWPRASRTLDRYRIPPIAVTRHEPGRWEYGRPWLQGLNSGDAAGELVPAEAPCRSNLPRVLARCRSAARQAFERRLATVGTTDSVAMMGGHQVGARARVPRPPAAGRPGAASGTS